MKGHRRGRNGHRAVIISHLFQNERMRRKEINNDVTSTFRPMSPPEGIRSFALLLYSAFNLGS
jgi:hypothetical protein